MPLLVENLITTLQAQLLEAKQISLKLFSQDHSRMEWNILPLNQTI